MRHAPFHHAHRREHTLRTSFRETISRCSIAGSISPRCHGAKPNTPRPICPARSICISIATCRVPSPPRADAIPCRILCGWPQGLAQLGVDADTQLVAYDQGNGAHAARLWWLARWIGIRNVAVLDGGFAAWRAAGLPLEQTVRGAANRKRWPCRSTSDAWVSSEDVDELRLRPGNLLVDARGAERFAGPQRDHRSGCGPCARREKPSFPGQSRR